MTSKNNSPSTSKPSSPPPPSEKKSDGEEASKNENKTEADPVQAIVETNTKAGTTSTPEINTRKNGNTSKKRLTIKLPPAKSPAKPKKTSKRLSAKIVVKANAENPPATPERVKASPTVATPKKKNQVVNFVPGSSIEAQNFDGKWLPVKVIEVDMEEREVLVRSCDKNNKSKTGLV